MITDIVVEEEDDEEEEEEESEDYSWNSECASLEGRRTALHDTLT